MLNQIKYVKNLIDDLENGYIAKTQYRFTLPYCIQIQNGKALFYNREYEVITNDDFETKQNNKLNDESYYKSSQNFDFAFEMKTSSYSYNFYNGDNSTLMSKKNIEKYIVNLRKVLEFIETNSDFPENEKFFYVNKIS